MYATFDNGRYSRLRRNQLRSHLFAQTFDQVNVLHGHSGCVNAITWALQGEILATGGDDTTVRFWRMDSDAPDTDPDKPYPFACTQTLHTGHRGNIFNIKMLPDSSQMVTVAADCTIRVFDIAHKGLTQSNSTPTRILECHTDRVKRIVVENSHSFLTVSEDGSVRQHDLRQAPHCCEDEECPRPIIRMNHELSTMSVSSLAPHLVVVAGHKSPFGHLFDRRHNRSIEAEWGRVPLPDNDTVTRCVRRFRRPSSHRRNNVTGVRMSETNREEVLMSYSGDGVYLFSTHDEPEPFESRREPSMLSHTRSNPQADFSDQLEDERNTSSRSLTGPAGSGVPVVFPRQKYTGALNLRTTKDVNFLGPRDEYVVSGSDDGNFFVWSKNTGEIKGIYEGDHHIVNVIEGHPHFPLVAVSGLDHTVKLFAPVLDGASLFSRMANAATILEANARRNNDLRLDFISFIMGHWDASTDSE